MAPTSFVDFAKCSRLPSFVYPPPSASSKLQSSAIERFRQSLRKILDPCAATQSLIFANSSSLSMKRQKFPYSVLGKSTSPVLASKIGLIVSANGAENVPTIFGRPATVLRWSWPECIPAKSIRFGVCIRHTITRSRVIGVREKTDFILVIQRNRGSLAIFIRIAQLGGG